MISRRIYLKQTITAIEFKYGRSLRTRLAHTNILYLLFAGGGFGGKVCDAMKAAGTAALGARK